MIENTNGSEEFVVDNDAKIVVSLLSKIDKNQSVFYTGKLQFNGSLSLKEGQSFMIFTSESGCEEMQIGPLAPSRKRSSAKISGDGRIDVFLRAHTDQRGNKFYVGELRGIGEINMSSGLFFTVFTATEGRERLQITPLAIKKKVKRHEEEEREELKAG